MNRDILNISCRDATDVDSTFKNEENNHSDSNDTADNHSNFKEAINNDSSTKYI